MKKARTLCRRQDKKRSAWICRQLSRMNMKIMPYSYHVLGKTQAIKNRSQFISLFSSPQSLLALPLGELSAQLTERSVGTFIMHSQSEEVPSTSLPTTNSLRICHPLLPSPPHLGHLSHWRGKGFYQLGKAVRQTGIYDVNGFWMRVGAGLWENRTEPAWELCQKIGRTHTMGYRGFLSGISC